ncbi:MAG: sulfatase-like hydrolase/transferase [Acidimicrobiales bacterium]|nr:sulfatase-like hydrolase/transferase [Acidimicrobiales bacterium]
MGDVESEQGPGLRPRPLDHVLLALAAAQPFVGFGVANRDELSQPGRMVVYALIVFGVLEGVLWLVTRWGSSLNGRTVALLETWFAVSFFNYAAWLPPSIDDERRWIPVAVWTLVTALVAWLLARVGSRPALRVGAAVWLAVSVGADLLVVATPSLPVAAPATHDAALPPPVPSEGPPPNIYYFVLDEYARADQLEIHAGFDNGAFVTRLEELGLTVSDAAWASYPRTQVSVPSTLDMAYLAEPGAADGPDAQFAPRVAGDNAVVRRLREHGYSFVYSSGAADQWSSCQTPLADRCLEPTGVAAGDLERALLKQTPLSVFDLVRPPYSDPETVLAELRTEPVREPYFLFAHVMSPHFPYRFDASCAVRDRFIVAELLSFDERKAAYVNDVRCLNDRVERALEQIVADDPGAVVIVQSDHGSALFANWDRSPGAWSEAAIADRFAVLQAIRLPAHCPAAGDVDLVNTFRVVFSCIEDQPVDLLPHRAFLWMGHDLVTLEEVDPSTFDR